MAERASCRGRFFSWLFNRVFEAFEAEQNLTGEGHSQVWMQQVHCFILDPYYLSAFLLDIWIFVGLLGVDDEGHLLLVDI